MDLYTTVKAFHIIAMVAWMAGLLYLPRLFVYHAGVAKGSEMSETFKVMEERLFRYIMNPAMIATWVLGLLLMFVLAPVDLRTDGWLHAKLLLVLILSGFHGALSKYRKQFAADQNTRDARFYRIANDVPTVLMIGIVILAVAKPF